MLTRPCNSRVVMGACQSAFFMRENRYGVVVAVVDRGLDKCLVRAIWSPQAQRTRSSLSENRVVDSHPSQTGLGGARDHSS